jgi:outer membrane protein TolC
MAPAQPAGPLGLLECLQLAHERQPRIARGRIELALAQERYQTLLALRVPNVLAPDLPIRRRQSSLGLPAATAALDKSEREAAYAVTRSWFTVLFARAQEKVARKVVTDLEAVRQAAKLQLEAGAKGVSTADVERGLVYARLAQTKQIEAEGGVKRALAALREAMGMGPDFHIDVPDRALPDPKQKPVLEQVVALALGRRGEIIQAGVFADVVGLEVEAQAVSCGLRVQTFAAGSDVHSTNTPQKIANSEYRPGAFPPEMPTVLFGHKSERCAQAKTLHARAGALLQTSRNLIALEAEDAFLRWQQADRQAARAQEAATAGDKMASNMRMDFTSGATVPVETLINALVTASQARGQFNEFRYRQILALADLERITAGGFCAGLVEAVMAPAPEKKNGSTSDQAGQQKPPG